MKVILEKLKEFFLSSRVKSLAWRLGMMFIAGGIQFIADNLVSLEISTQATVVLGLILGELSKYLNNRYQTSKGLR